MTDTPKKTTLVALVLDRTGSMMSCRDQVIAGFNEYLTSLQKDEIDTCLFSLWQFDLFEGNRDGLLVVLCTGAAVAGVKPLSPATYMPRGETPLYDAIGRAIHGVDKSGVVCDRVIMVIMTDGQENASREWDKKKLHDLIAEKEATGKWTFVFLGADQDAWGEVSKFAPAGSSMQTNARSYQKTRTTEAYASVARATASLRSSTEDARKDFFAGDPTGGPDPAPAQSPPPPTNPFSPSGGQTPPEPPKTNPFSMKDRKV